MHIKVVLCLQEGLTIGPFILCTNGHYWNLFFNLFNRLLSKSNKMQKLTLEQVQGKVFSGLHSCIFNPNIMLGTQKDSIYTNCLKFNSYPEAFEETMPCPSSCPHDKISRNQARQAICYQGTHILCVIILPMSLFLLVFFS